MKTSEIVGKLVEYYCFLEDIGDFKLDYKDWARIERLYNDYLEGNLELI